MSKSVSLLTRTPDPQNPAEIEEKISLLKGLTNQLQELTEQLGQTAAEQQSQQQQVEGVRAHLSESIGAFDSYVQELKNAMQASKRALDTSSGSLGQITHTGEEVTQLSQQLEALAHSIQHTAQEEAIAVEPRR